MPTDFNAIKIPVFSGINDVPVAPTANKAGNGSHLASKFNELVSAIQSTLISSSNDWIVVTEEYFAKAGDKILTFRENSTGGNYNIFLPETPQPTDSITLLLADPSASINLSYYHAFQGSFFDSTKITQSFEEVTLIFIDNTLGWIANKQNVVTAVNQET